MSMTEDPAFEILSDRDLAKYLVWDYGTKELVYPTKCQACDAQEARRCSTEALVNCSIAYCTNCKTVVKYRDFHPGSSGAAILVQEIDKNLHVQAPVQCDWCNGTRIGLGWISTPEGSRAVDVPNGCKKCCAPANVLA